MYHNVSMDLSRRRCVQPQSDSKKKYLLKRKYRLDWPSNSGGFHLLNWKIISHILAWAEISTDVTDVMTT